MTLDHTDDELVDFEARGAILPSAGVEGRVDHDGARIWYASYGFGKPVILLHGGMGHSGNWAYQVPALVSAEYRVVLIDSRGHGRSTRDARPYTYELMGTDVLAVMDELGISCAPIIGWSDGACIGMVLARQLPQRISSVFFFACNMDPSGTKPFEPTQVIERCIGRHAKDYAALSATPDNFQGFMDAVGEMQRTQPNYSTGDLGAIEVPVTIVQSELDEFIKLEHAEYLTRSIPGAELVVLPGVSHFAPLQRPSVFNTAVLAFLAKVPVRRK